MDPEDATRREEPEDPVEPEEAHDAEPLDSILSDMVGALKNVREVLAHTVRNVPVLEKGGSVVVAVRRSDGSTVQVRSEIDGSGR